MIRRFTIAVLLFFTLPLCAQDKERNKDGDRALDEMEARLQEQRAAAIRARLVLYTDELEKLHAQFTADGNTSAAAAVKSELDAVQLASRQLAAIARRQAEPPAPGELQKDETLSASGLAARRINRIIERFSAKTPARPAPGGSTLSVRQRILRFDKASRDRDYLDYGSRSYWGNSSAWALWSLTDIVPGEYEVVLRYKADPQTGGTAIVKIAGSKFDVTVPKGVKGVKEQPIIAGTVTIKEPGVDVRVENGGLTGKAQSLWDLEAVILQPVVKRP